MASVTLIRWHDLSPRDQTAVRSLRINQQQMEFAGSIDKAIAGVEAADDSVGLAIMTDGEVAGFLVVSRGSKTPNWAEAGTATLSAMRIDERKQGCGFGTAALLALSEWVAEHWPETSMLTLRVDEANAAGKRAYEKAGFIDHGVRLQGRIGPERIMSKLHAPRNAALT